MQDDIAEIIRERVGSTGSMDVEELAIEAVAWYALDPRRLLWHGVTAGEVVEAWGLHRYVAVRAA